MNLANWDQIAKLQPFKVKPPSKISIQYKTKISAFTNISSTFLSSKFFESGFAKVSSFTVPLITDCATSDMQYMIRDVGVHCIVLRNVIS